MDTDAQEKITFRITKKYKPCARLYINLICMQLIKNIIAIRVSMVNVPLPIYWKKIWSKGSQ